MARWLTVLIALVAQGMALMSPVCFVRCTGADGHESVELMSQACHCGEFRTTEAQPQVCGVATCSDHGHDHDEEQEAPAGSQIVAQDCSCLHSPLESAPQTVSKSLAADQLSAWQDVASAPTMFSGLTDSGAVENARFPRSRWRPHESPHLAVVAIVVLRV